jgi:hypothetical protein
MTPPDDQALARRLSATLDRAAATPDAELDRRVCDALATAKSTPTHPGQRWAWAGMALAAGVAALLWLPYPTPVKPVTATVASAPVTVEPEFLEDMELVAALGEDPDES